MLNRRSFLKTGLKPRRRDSIIRSAQRSRYGSTHPTEEAAAAAAGGATPKLIPLPPRLAPIDPATEPWQQSIRRVGQTNMTEHDPR